MIAFPVAGVLLLLVLTVDVFYTVFHSQGRGGPLNRRLSRLIWSAFRGLGRRDDGSARHRLLSYGGPVIVVTTLLVWIILLVLGYAMIYLPWMETFLASPGDLRTPWAEALYYSGYTAATLGLGDVVANTESLRLVTTLEAFGGFALLSVSITYFLAVYREQIAMQSLAADISGLFRSGEAQVLQFVREEGYEALARWSEQLAGGLSHVLLAHFQYPVLHFFHAAKQSHALPVQLGTLLALRRMVEADQESEVVGALARHPSYLALQDSLEEYLNEVNRYFVPRGAGSSHRKAESELERAHESLLDYMVYS